MIATTPNLATFTTKDLSDYAERFFVDTLKKVEPVARQLFRVDPIGMNQGTEKLYQEFDMQTFARAKGEGANTAKVQAGTGYTKLAQLKRIGAEIDITEEEMKYNKYPQVINKMKNLSTFVRQRQEIDLTHRLTFASATSYVNMDGQVVTITTGDGVALASASHLTAFSGVGYNNIITGSPVFSEANLAVAELVGATQVVSNYGEKRVMNFNKIFCADYPAVFNLMRQVIQSTAQISGPNAGVKNVYEAKYDIVKLPYLATTATGAYDSAKKNYWGLVAAGEWNAYLAIWEEENLRTPAPGNNLVDGHADVSTFGVRGGYDIAVVSGQGLLISPNAT
jgi:hypothetical protein